MTKRIERFEDFIAWQKARKLTADIYRVTSEGSFSRDFGLKDQIRRAAVSSMSNLAEGFERGRPAEFHQFLSIAKASCAELRAQLYVALDVGYISLPTFDRLMAQATEVGQILGGLRQSVERRRDSVRR
ncbi:MAG TPA: four helix bundle protein [Pyrinomonadaceae bacterium]|nr:four helix bundle protein [Pyrinomonadaceae bacterium]